MSQDARPILSVIARRFRQELRDDIENLVKRTQQAVSNQPGFVGLQNSLTSGENGCELVTVFSFDSHENLERWENSPVRKGFVEELDRHSLDNSTYTKFDGLALLNSPKARVSKIETVAILIFWILVLGGILGYLADFLLPESLDLMWRNVLIVSVNVVLISYVFLPWSSTLLTRLKARLSRSA